MTRQRRHFSGPEKVAALKRHLVEKVPVSDLCDQLGIAPNLFYRWQKEFFDNGHSAFDSGRKVLHLLGFQPGRSHGAQQRGPCPLHGSTSGTSHCFSVHLEDQTFHCFKCGQSGNALDLWAQTTQQSAYDAALDLCQRLGIPVPRLASPPRKREEEPVAPGSAPCTIT